MSRVFPRRAGAARMAVGDVAPGSRAAGFSLLEILIALLVLAVGAASVLSLFAAGAATHRRSVDRTNAALIAERVFAEVRAAYTATATRESILAAVASNVPEDIDGYRWDVRVARPAYEDGGREGAGSEDPGAEGWRPDELIVRVTVRWQSAALERAEVFHELILPRHVPGEVPTR